MTKKLKDALRKQKRNTKQETPLITGILGIPLGGKRLVEVPNRKPYVYVRLRNNQNEVIQAFNNQVAPSYNLPVIVERQGNRYSVISVDTQRYENNWTSFAPFLPRHGNTHSFDPEGGGGGDIVFVHTRQFMPMLAIPSGSSGGPNVVLSSYVLKRDDNTWVYVGNTGTQNLTPHNPTGSSAVMALVYLDATNGNPGFLIGSGSYFSNTITGTNQVVPYIPNITNPSTQIPISAIRLVSGTSAISWDNIYDVRQFIYNSSTGVTLYVQDEGIHQGEVSTFNFVGSNVSAIASGGVAQITVGGLTGSSVAIQDEGAPQGNVTTLNVVGTVADISVSGTVARLFITGSTGGGTLAVQDEGISQGTATTFNFVGDGVTATISGSVARINVVATGSASVAELDTRYLKLDTSNDPIAGELRVSGTFDAGYGKPNREANAGKFGYEAFTPGYFDWVGAGTGTPRWHRFYDNTLASVSQAQNFQLLTLPNAFLYTNGTGTFAGPINAPQLTTITGTDYVLGIKGSDSSSVKTLVNDLAEGIVYTDVIGTFTGGDTVQPTGTYSTCPWKSSIDSTANNLPWPEGGLATDLSVRISSTQPASGSLVITLMINSVATALVVTIPAGSTLGTYSDTTHQVSISASDFVRWNVQNNATTTSAAITGLTMKLNKRATA